jgi:hypothetical protein
MSVLTFAMHQSFPSLTYIKFVLDHRSDTFGSPSDKQVFFQEFAKFIPNHILEYIVNTTKNPRITRLRETGNLAMSVAKQMVKDKAEMLLQGKGSRDVFSLLGGYTSSFRSSKSDNRHS